MSYCHVWGAVYFSFSPLGKRTSHFSGLCWPGENAVKLEVCRFTKLLLYSLNQENLGVCVNTQHTWFFTSNSGPLPESLTLLILTVPLLALFWTELSEVVPWIFSSHSSSFGITTWKGPMTSGTSEALTLHYFSISSFSSCILLLLVLLPPTANHL